MFKFLSKSKAESELKSKPGKKSKGEARTYTMPDDEIAYAIGDVHGCLASLKNLLERIELDRAARPEKKSTIVFLGDLIDRGPSSREVLEFLMSYKPDWTNIIFLMGNHEEVMIEVLDGDISAMRSWFEFGGKACARSYGVDNFGQLHINPDHIMMALQRSVPKEHIRFISGFRDAFSFGDYLFVHAGIRPKIPIKDQSPHDMRWIRSRFLEYKKPHPVMVVHGHTVVDDGPELHSNRIAIDTGAHKGQPLTAVALASGKTRFIQSEALGA